MLCSHHNKPSWQCSAAVPNPAFGKLSNPQPPQVRSDPRAPHPIGICLVGISTVSRANMAVSVSSPLARLISDTCAAGTGGGVVVVVVVGGQGVEVGSSSSWCEQLMMAARQQSRAPRRCMQQAGGPLPDAIVPAAGSCKLRAPGASGTRCCMLGAVQWRPAAVPSLRAHRRCYAAATLTVMPYLTASPASVSVRSICGCCQRAQGWEGAGAAGAVRAA